MVLSLISLGASWPVQAKEIRTAEKLVILDPGHGGNQKGIQVPSDRSEDDICLSLAEMTAALLDSTYNVMLTRSKDQTLSPDKRVSLANQNKADIYISIHLSRAGAGYGGFYYFALPGTATTKNAHSDDHWHTAALAFSLESKRAIQIFQDIFTENRPVLNYITAPVPSILLEGAKMPAIIIEPFPAATLPLDPVKRKKALTGQAQLIKKGVDTFFAHHPAD